MMNGWNLFQQNRYGEALALAQAAVGRSPVDPGALQLAAEAALRLGRSDVALDAAARLVATEAGKRGWAQILHARCLHVAGETAAAAAAALRAVEMGATDDILLGDAGAILSASNLHDEALMAFQRAVELRPDDPAHCFNLAMEQRFLGLIQAAEANCDRTIALDPDHGEAWVIRAGLRRQTPERNHVDATRRKLAGNLPDWRVKAQLHYALAKELEDLGDYEASFAALSAGADLRRRHTQFDVGVDIARIDALIDGFQADAFAENRSNGCLDDGPIFVIGMPRTGTTLVERIFGRHPHVHAAGELPAFTEALMSLMRDSGFRGGGPDDMIAAAKAVPPQTLGHAYLDRAAPFRGTKEHFVDKLPLNFLYCGLIARALPNARIIHVRRDPMDSCYAMFKTWFDSAYPFSYDLVELASYYAAYMRLMEHWRRVMPGRIVEIDYERLVDDVDSAARYLIGSCGLDWDPACAAPHDNHAPSTTASASQIREPVHRQSIGRWRNYEAQLSPLSQTLEQLGVLRS
jgi:tetratricopeptide (TPR) repeat protein